MSDVKTLLEVFERHAGILRLAPNWVPRGFSSAGKRLRLHPDDYFCLGTARGSIKERWFCSTVAALNGPLAPADEGLSYVDLTGGRDGLFLFKDAVAELGARLVGPELMERFGTWPMYSKFFDYDAPLFLHLHHRDQDAAKVGSKGKPEAYYYPPQLNDHPGQFPHTFFGFDPDVTREEVRERLARFGQGDNRITELSRAYRIQLGTGWYTPPGVAHAPGSFLTYEPQWNSDVSAVFENMVSGEVFSHDFMVAHCPEDRRHDLDFVMGLLDWEKNVDPHYRRRWFRPGLPAGSGPDHQERWVVYDTGYIAAKELTVLPGRTAVVRDQAAYGCILTQGHGSFGGYPAETAVMLRHGGLSADEFFVSEAAAQAGVSVTNHSLTEPLVLLKHFGPNAGDPAHPM
jgi:hypothetical protein